MRVSVRGARLSAMSCNFLGVAIIWKETVEKTAGPSTSKRPMLVHPLRRELHVLPVLNEGSRARGLRIFSRSKSDLRKDVAKDSQKEQAETWRGKNAVSVGHMRLARPLSALLTVDDNEGKLLHFAPGIHVLYRWCTSTKSVVDRGRSGQLISDNTRISDSEGRIQGESYGRRGRREKERAVFYTYSMNSLGGSDRSS